MKNRPESHCTAIFERFYTMTVQATAVYIARRVRNPEDVADLQQEVYLKAWRAWPRAPEHTRLWVQRIAQNTIIDYYRVQARRREDDLAPLSFALEARDPIAAWHDRITLHEVLPRIDQRDREVLLLRAAGHSFEEIAAAKGITMTRCYYLYHHARAQALRAWQKVT